MQGMLYKGTREMNANELADELENTYPFVGVMEVAATMLRQQQAEIEALKSRELTLTNDEIEEIAKEFKDVDYTLDEEEAFDVFNHRGFARAILRKAQEK